MKINSAVPKYNGIEVSATVDGEERKYLFALDRDSESIKEELQRCEDTIKLEKKQWAENAEQDALNTKASKTISNLLK